MLLPFDSPSVLRESDQPARNFRKKTAMAIFPETGHCSKRL
jgi:hypothetical protein